MATADTEYAMPTTNTPFDSSPNDPGRSQVQKILDGLLQAGRDDEITIPWQPSNEKFEGCTLLGFARPEVSGGHRELIKIRAEPKAHWVFFSA